jgi:predicted RND superfamily exporter protein
MKIRDLGAVLLLAMVVPALFVVNGVTVDNRLERWQGGDPVDAEVYEEFRANFGSDEFVLICLWDGPLFDPDSLDTMMDVAGAIEIIPGIARVQGLPVIYRDIFAGEDADALEIEMTSTPFYRDLFISSGGEAAAIVATISPPDDPAARRAIMRRIREGVKPLEAAGFTIGLVGSTALIDALDQMSESESRRGFAVALALSMLALSLLSRSLRAMTAAAACAATSVILTMALVVLTGHTLNMITSVLPALMWVLALSGIIHLVRRFRHHRVNHGVDQALHEALRDTTRPMVLASVTTAAGFLSLVTAGMEPVRELGLFAAVGILVSLAVNLLLGPLLIRRLSVPEAATAADPEFHGRWLHLGSTRPRTVIAAALLLVLGALASLPFIRVASNPLGFLPEDHPTSVQYRRVSESLSGFYTLEVVLDLPGAWTDPAGWGSIDVLAEELAASPIVARVISPLDLLRKLEHWDHDMVPSWYRLPRSGADAEALLETLDSNGRETLDSLVSEDGGTIRLSAIVNEMDEHLFLDLEEQARKALVELPPGFSGRVTGQVLQLVNAQQTLVSSQLRSVAFALLVVFIVVGVGLRSVKLTALSVLPNVVPLLAAFAVMSAAGITLDAATVMVASIALGIAVDDTVHLLVAIDRQESQGATSTSVRRALEHVGPALVLTTVAACIGFFALMTSAFVPIRFFGLLSGTAMLVALAADLWLVPAILVLFGREEGV